MPPKPRGKGKAAMASIEEVRNAARARQNEKGERPPTSEEFAQMMKNAGNDTTSSTQQHLENQQNKKQKSDQINIHKGGSAKATASLNKNTAFIPPGADIQSKSLRNAFMNQFEEHFILPQRLRKIPTSLVEGVNDFHFAMMNDKPRNEFYYQMLKEHIVAGETTVLEIGAGSGLLSMMAASLGAKWVVAVEGSTDMARLAQKNIDANKFTDRVRVLNKMSTDLQVSDLPSKPDVLVSEIFGTLLLGESALEYLEDIRRRNIVRKDTKILPRYGKQYCCVVECPTLEQICGVEKHGDLDLTLMNSLRDTASCVFTKKYGFRMSSVPFKRLTAPIELLSLDFENTRVRDVPIEFSVESRLLQPGTGHAYLYWWASWNKEEDVKDMKVDEKTGAFTGIDQIKVMSTDPEHTREQNFPRDMQWGQALQLADAGMGPLPQNIIFTQEDYEKSKKQFEESVAKKQEDSAASGKNSSNKNNNKNKNQQQQEPEYEEGGIYFTCRTSDDRVILQMEYNNDDDNGDFNADEEWGADEEDDDDQQ